MDWAKKTHLVLIAGSLVTGCAGAGHKLPAISEADSARANREIVAAPSLQPTTKTAHENERIARRAMSRLQTAARPICAATDRGSCWYTLEFSPKGEMNAYVIKNQIVMFNGLAQYLETEDEFAAVLGHEMGHHISKHYEKAIQNRMAGALITGIIFAGIAGTTNAYQNNPNQAQTDMQNAMAIGAAIGNISFSKEHEREADYIAAYLLARANYNPDAAGKVWIKLTKASGRMKTQLFDTHPAGPDRLAAWQQTIDEVRYSTDLMPNFVNAKDEPRLQQARIFNDAIENPSVRETDLALASPTYLSKTDILGDIAKALDTSGHSVVNKLRQKLWMDFLKIASRNNFAYHAAPESKAVSVCASWRWSLGKPDPRINWAFWRFGLSDPSLARRQSLERCDKWVDRSKLQCNCQVLRINDQLVIDVPAGPVNGQGMGEGEGGMVPAKTAPKSTKSQPCQPGKMIYAGCGSAD